MNHLSKPKAESIIVGLILVATIFAGLYVGSLFEIERKDRVISEMERVMTPGQVQRVRQRLDSGARQ